MDRNLRSYNLAQLEELVLAAGEKKFRAKQLYGWIHGKNIVRLDEMSNLGKNMLGYLQSNYHLGEMKLEARQISQDKTEKYLFSLSDGQAIECVLMRYRGDKSKQRNTLCVSSQVGCAMGCTFCATGQSGFCRNLTIGEIVGQVYEVNHLLMQQGEEMPIGNVVFMGMGEPMLNYDAVIAAIRLLNDPAGQNIGIRRISISTCGILGGLERLAQEGLDIVLAISLHAANDADRSKIMPINDRYPLAELIKACRNYQKKTQNRISFEYALIQGMNDRSENIRQIANLLQGLDCHINVIPINPVANTTDMIRPQKEATTAFVRALQKAGVNASVREEKGTDIDGACGQLRGKLRR